MKVYLIHHTDVLSAEQDPGRHLSPTGREDADGIGARFTAAGVAPVRILHSDKQWTLEAAERIAATMGLTGLTAIADYSIGTTDPIEPFLAEIGACDGDIMMVGHADFLIRSASSLLCGDEDARVIEFKPGYGTAFCLEKTGDNWAVTFAWRLEHSTD
jgi:phosphohistidine phosphatase SixA